MTIKRYNSEKDNTIVNALRENLSARGTGANLGASDILEIFSIYGQASSSSLEQARILVQFPIKSISDDRDAGILPSSGSISFKLKMSNTPHGQTTPKSYTLVAHPLARAWNEGTGLDMESYLDIEASNWLSASENTPWHTTGSDFLTASYVTPAIVPIQYEKSLELGTEDFEVDITGLTEEWIKYHKGVKTAATANINFSKNPTMGRSKATGHVTVSGDPTNDGTFTLKDASNKTQVFIINTDDNDFDGTTNDGSGRTPIGVQAVLGNNNDIAERIKTAINGQTTVGITAARTNNKVTLSQDNTGSLGNTTITLTNLSNVSKGDFTGGFDEQLISIYSHEGQNFNYTFITASTYSINNNVFLKLSGTAANTAAALKNRIDSDFGGKITTGISGASLSLTQSVSGIQGNTIVSSSIPSATASISGFSGGTAMPNYGMIVKLREDYEDGSRKRSYYTKKFYSRSSHEFFLKPKIEAQWDSSIRDDRSNIIRSSSLAPSDDNLNNIYYYNRFRGNLVDIPNTGSSIIVKFYTSTAGNPENVTLPGGAISTFVSSSKHSTGVYKATFAFSGSAAKLTDVWMRSLNGTETTLFTGSGFSITSDGIDASHSIPNYVANITNLKESYLQGEKATFRVYTRNKNWSPNIYTKAEQKAPVNNIRDMYYKITKVSDNYEVISYSTSSSPNYSSLSYDSSGSYFDLDMALLQKNNAYQINFVFKDGSNYIELPEKFRFRVNP